MRPLSLLTTLRPARTFRSLPYTLHRALTTSHVRGPSTPPLLECTVPEHFESVVAKYGTRTAVVSRHQKTRLSYAQLHAKSNALASGLRRIGVGKGDRVAVSMGNTWEYAVATYALFSLGAILVPLNPAFTPNQVISALNHLTASHLLISSETNLSRRPPSSNLTLLNQLLSDPKPVPSLQHIAVADNSDSRVSLPSGSSVIPFNELLSREDEAFNPNVRLSNNDVVNIQFTSGTTSMPKAACLTHRSILNNGFSIGERMLLTEQDVVVCPPPLFHCFGCILGYMATATHGSAIVFPNEAFDAEATLRAVQEEKATALYGVPTMFNAMLELLANGTVAYEGFQYLRTGIAAGSSIPSHLMSRLHKILNLTELTICYGMTETSPVSCMTTTDDPLDMRLSSVGRLLPHVEAKVVDANDRSKVLGVGQRGELVVAGYLVMKEYWDDEARTKEVLVEDNEGKKWMHTGDEAQLLLSGHVEITGRLKDIIIRGGENIHPLEIENCILAAPGISDASVIGIKDEHYGEIVGVFIIKDESEAGRGIWANILNQEEYVKDWVRQMLSKHTVPKHVFFTSGYPKTASGKIQKFKLRELAANLLAGGHTKSSE